MAIRNLRRHLKTLHSCSYSYKILCSVFCYSDQPDCFDLLIENLVEENADKWNVCAAKIGVTSNTKSVLNRFDLNSCYANNNYNPSNSKLYSPTDFYTLCNEAVRCNNLTPIVEKLHLYHVEHICPPPKVLLHLANLFATNGCIEGINAIQKVSKKCNKEEFENQGAYIHYLAEANWVSNKIKESLELFEESHKKYTHLHLKLRSLLKYLTRDVISNHGEGTLLIVHKFTVDFSLRHHDFSLMNILWGELFESEWYADQKLAAKLLDQYPQLRNVVQLHIPIIGRRLLRCNNTSDVHRLIEVLLLYKMSDQCTQLLQALFDYHYARADLRSCSAVVKSSIELDMSLTEDQLKRFLSLLLNCKQATVDKSTLKGMPCLTKFQMKY